MISSKPCIGAALLAAALAGPVWAHVTLSQPQAAAGSFYTAYFRVGHGCSGSATTALRIEIPPDVTDVRPQPKPGWVLHIERDSAAAPAVDEKGHKVPPRVLALTWTGGPLPDDEWDEFGVSARLPARTGAVSFPAIQTCEQGEERWIEPPTAPHAPGDHNSRPAPSVTLLPAPGQADMPSHEGMEMRR